MLSLRKQQAQKSYFVVPISAENSSWPLSMRGDDANRVKKAVMEKGSSFTTEDLIFLTACRLFPLEALGKKPVYLEFDTSSFSK